MSNSNKIIQQIEQEQMAQKEVPDFGPGDTVVVQVRVKEGDKERDVLHNCLQFVCLSGYYTG